MRENFTFQESDKKRKVFFFLFLKGGCVSCFNFVRFLKFKRFLMVGPKFGKLFFFHRVRNPIEVILGVEGLAHLRLFLDSSNGFLPGFDRKSPQLPQACKSRKNLNGVPYPIKKGCLSLCGLAI